MCFIHAVERPHMPAKDQPPQFFDWRKLPQLVKEWKEFVIIIATAIAAGLTILGVRSQGVAQIISYSTVVLLLVVGAFLVYRSRHRQQRARPHADSKLKFENQRLKRTTFRGLYPYQESDILPGDRRRREAQTIFTQITDAEFSFGVVCGESGCGKTSLLRCTLQGLLKEARSQSGMRVLYIGGLNELSNEELIHSSKVTEEERLEYQLDRLKSKVLEAGRGLPILLIIDQFEDFLVQYTKKLPARLGGFLKELIHATPATRVLCAIRRDYLADIQYLAPHLPEPLSVKTLFTLNNFTTEEAAAVIIECAELDDIKLDHELANIIAMDLAESGYVRPPELQIVCTALASNATLSEYRLRGGARGILAHHISSSITACESPRLASQVLRSLCSFSSNIKRNPQTVDEIFSTLILPESLKREEAMRIVRTILNQLVEARIIKTEPNTADETYTLVHDYLVKSVDDATADDKNRLEKANQFLQYYLLEYAEDAKNKIPGRRYRFIKKYADKSLLQEPRAKRLLKASRNAWIMYLTALIAVVLFTTTALLIVLTTERTWEPKLLNQILPDTGSIMTGGDIFLIQKDLMFTFAEDTDTRYAKLWQAKTAQLRLDKRGEHFVLDEQGKQFIIVEDKNARLANAVHLETGTEYQLPISAGAIAATTNLEELVRFSPFNGVLIISNKEYSTLDREYPSVPSSEANRSFPAGPPPPPPPIRADGIRIWSIPDQKERGLVATASWTTNPLPYLDKTLTRLLAVHSSDAGGEWQLWKVGEEKTLATLATSDEQLLNYSVDEVNRRFVVVKSPKSDYRKMIIQVRDLESGNVLSPERVWDIDPSKFIYVYFSNQGDFVVLAAGSSQEIEEPFTILHTANLVPAEYTIGKEVKWADTIDEPGKLQNVYWADDQGTYIWEVGPKPPKFLAGLILHPLKRDDGSNRERLMVVPAKNRVLVKRLDWHKELYDLNDSRKIADLDYRASDWKINFTYDGTAISVQARNGANYFYSLETGQKVAQIQNSAPSVSVFDADCRRITVWYSEGSIYRYTESFKILGLWAWPTKRCD